MTGYSSRASFYELIACLLSLLFMFPVQRVQKKQSHSLRRLLSVKMYLQGQCSQRCIPVFSMAYFSHNVFLLQWPHDRRCLSNRQHSTCVD